MPPNRFESEVESFLEGSHGDRTHIKRADHHTVTPLCGTLLPEMAQLGAFSACRESFVPLWLAQHRAGRILYRTQGRDRASQHNNTPGTTGVKAPEGAEGPEEPQDPAAVPGAVAGPGRSTPRVTAITTLEKVACNSPATRINARSKTAEYQRLDFNT